MTCKLYEYTQQSTVTSLYVFSVHFNTIFHVEFQTQNLCTILKLHECGRHPFIKQYIQAKAVSEHHSRIFLLTMRCFFFAATKREGPTTGLKPGSPQNLVPSHLTGNTVFMCVTL